MKLHKQSAPNGTYRISEGFTSSKHVVVYPGDCLDLLKTISSELKMARSFPERLA